MSPDNIVALIRAISGGRYEPIDPDSLPDSDDRELARALNQLDRDRRSLTREAGERSRIIIDSTPVAICITNEHGTYEYVNPNYRALTGYDDAELIGAHFTLVVPPEARAELVELHDSFMGRHTELEGEWEIVHRDGHRIPILANAAYITDVDGRPKKVTFVTDITSLRTAQQYLEAEIAERKRVERLRDEVERVMRHDLRNPIDGIRTAANFLLEEDLTARQAEFVQLMYDAAVRARTRIDSSLAYARMQRGQYVIERKRVNLVQLVRDVLRDIDSAVRAYRVRIDTSYRGRPLAAQFDVELWGEHDFLSDAITNLTRNAIEASEAEQVVSLSVDDEVMMDGGIPAVSVTIHNETPIPAEIRARLFDPWVTHGKRGGSGLGTYTALLVVQAHGGTITVDSDAARGTTVTIVLPRGRMGDPGAPVLS